MRIATWNLKQAVAPKKLLPELWRWAADCIRPDCIVFTEGKVPYGLPSGTRTVCTRRNETAGAPLWPAEVSTSSRWHR